MDKFQGFEEPRQNFSRLPHLFIDVLPDFGSMAELKVVLYVIRHTWGFSEYGILKKITIDEFMNGRKRRDGTRMDKGTGLSENSVRSGLEKAVEHGFLCVETDDRDAARVEKWYCLLMQAGSELAPLNSTLDPLDSELAPRTEKETKGKKLKKIKSAPLIDKPPSATSLLLDAFKTHFKLTLRYGHPWDTPFLTWAQKEVMITPELVMVCAAWWNEPEQLRWRPNGPNINDIQVNWLRSIEGYNSNPSPDDSDFDMTITG